jgi:hypothetical protein
MLPWWNHAELYLAPFYMAIFRKYERAVVTRINIDFILKSRFE